MTADTTTTTTTAKEVLETTTASNLLQLFPYASSPSSEWVLSIGLIGYKRIEFKCCWQRQSSSVGQFSLATYFPVLELYHIKLALPFCSQVHHISWSLPLSMARFPPLNRSVYASILTFMRRMLLYFAPAHSNSHSNSHSHSYSVSSWSMFLLARKPHITYPDLWKYLLRYLILGSLLTRVRRLRHRPRRRGWFKLTERARIKYGQLWALFHWP